ncbi:hypothetical protein [Bacillus sp. SRB3LM]|uniref:hypothetical protein n=1 Tax=Bacillus sp. SRB3LM TaxID=2608689 RepID=UPI0018C44FEE|nr:hypothetical protein [Bacillus sp. SRB3LM]MBG0969282.1 hypothetical protein [Bacillus sp. SRB3LM]MBG0973329.1 hypothetical protein [Bacillus sp. SRB3LM]
MKKKITSVLALTIAAASLPVTALAADNSAPVTKNGERLKYNTPYYLKDKNLPDKGGVTFEHWGLDDFVLFAESSTDNGTPIIFENKDGADGFIESNDEIRIKSTKANEPGVQYWARDALFDSIYLNYDNTIDHIIYGSSEDNSIGLGSFMTGLDPNTGKMFYNFLEYKGGNEKKAWMKSGSFQYVSNPGNGRFTLPLDDKQTPFEVMEASE